MSKKVSNMTKSEIEKIIEDKIEKELKKHLRSSEYEKDFQEKFVDALHRFYKLIYMKKNMWSSLK